MKRNSLPIAAAVLSGILCGLPGVSIVWKISVPLITVCLISVLCFKSRGRNKSPLLFLLAVIFAAFIAGFFRTGQMNQLYNSEESLAFFEKYESTNPGEFDYALYLKTMGVHDETGRTLLKERIPELETPLKNKLNDIKAICSCLLDKTLSEENAGIIKAMLLGDKTSMETDTKQLYQSAGISHLLAVSGLHVGLIGTGCRMFLDKISFTGKRVNLLCSGFVVCLYCIFTGAAASSVRAALMLCIGFAAVLTGKKADPITALCTAAVFLLLKQPYVLLQSGFLLSFSAMCGVYTGIWLLNSYEIKNKLISSFVSCISISIATLPVLAYSYYKLPLFSVLLNMIVIPLMSILFLFSILLLLSSFLYSVLYFIPLFSQILLILVRLFSEICTGILSFYDLLSTVSLKLGISQIITGKPDQFRILLYYLLVSVLLIYAVCRKNRTVKYLTAMLLMVYLSSFPFIRVHESNDPYIEVLDVGQGDCFHIHDGSRNIVIDCGSSGSERAGSRVLEPYLLSKGIGRIDTVIISHADADHTNGIRYLLEENSILDIGTIILPALARKDEKYGQFKENIVYCNKGNRLELENGILSCVFCEEDSGIMNDTNRESSVWLYEHEGFKMLFTGDITSKEEEKIVQSDSKGILRNLNILKAAHHGSKTANSENFINYTNPEITVLSFGKNNRYGHPSSEVLDILDNNGTEKLSTDQYGAIKIVPLDDGYEINTWKEKESGQIDD